MSVPVLEPAPRSAPAESPRTPCFACGADHPEGLRLVFGPAKGGGVEALWVPEAKWQGYEGIVHGGIVSTVLDEAMSKAVAASGRSALTGELRVRFRLSVVPGEALRLRAWVNKSNRRLLATEASLCGADGLERAHAWASFVPPHAAHHPKESS